TAILAATGTVPAGAGLGLAGAGLAGAAATTRPAVPAGSGTAILPAVPPTGDKSERSGGRRRGLLLTGAAVLVLATLATVLALANPGIFPGSKTPPAPSTSVSPTAPAGAVPATTRGPHRTTKATQQNSATTGGQ